MSENLPAEGVASEFDRSFLAAFGHLPRRPQAEELTLALERALLGAILVNNETFFRVAHFLEPGHFIEPIHQKIYDLSAQWIRAEKVPCPSPISLKNFLPPDTVIYGRTVSQYLAWCAAETVCIKTANKVGRLILELARERGVIVEPRSFPTLDQISNEFMEALHAGAWRQLEEIWCKFVDEVQVLRPDFTLVEEDKALAQINTLGTYMEKAGTGMDCPIPTEPLPEVGFYESDEWREVRYRALKLHGGCCQCCGNRASPGKPLHVDHIKPRSKYPELELELDNLQVLCADCNLGKMAWDETDWRPKEEPPPVPQPATR